MMRKFDETMHANQNWEDITINDKWTPVIIESPNIIGWDDTVKMICQCDGMFSGYRIGGGNDPAWNRIVWDEAGVPEDIPSWLCAEDNVSLMVQTMFREAQNKFRKDWNSNPSIHSDATVFQSELFSSSFAGGPFSFVNLKTGKVGLVHNIGKWCGKIGHVADELRWFAKNYPQYKFFVTFCDYYYVGNKATQIELCTLMLYNGKIVRVKTRTKSQFKYVYKINQLKGSTSARKTVEFWSCLLSFGRNFYAWRHRTVLPKISVELYNEWVIDRNYSLLDCKAERYFDVKHMCAIIDDYKRIIKEDK